MTVTTETINAFIAIQLAKPITHNVIIAYQDGKKYIHGARSLAQAQNHVQIYRHKIGKDLINRDTGCTVKIISVTVEEI